MTEEHPSISLFKQLDLRNLGEAPDLFAEDFVWHYGVERPEDGG